MHTPANEYMAFWLGFGFVVICLWPWLFCGLVVISGLRKKNVRRVLFAIMFGPLLLRDSGFRN